MATVNYDAETGETYLANERPAFDGSKPHHLEDYYLDNYGNTHHRFEDVVYDEELEADPVREDYDQWLQETYIELYGGQEQYNEMVNYALQHWDAEDIRLFNETMDSNDQGSIEEALAHLNEMYLEHISGGAVSDEDGAGDEFDPEDVEDWFESLDDEVLDQTVDELMETEFTSEQSAQMESLQTQYDPESVESDILSVGQLVAKGELEMSDAIETIINLYGEANAARAYFELQQIFSTYY